MNIKRLAAIDMHGGSGAVRRKQLVQAEFTAALAVMVALGIWLAIDASGLGTRILGIWLIVLAPTTHRWRRTLSCSVGPGPRSRAGWR